MAQADADVERTATAEFHPQRDGQPARIHFELRWQDGDDQYPEIVDCYSEGMRVESVYDEETHIYRLLIEPNNSAAIAPTVRGIGVAPLEREPH